MYPTQINVEYFFRLIYELFTGGNMVGYGSFSTLMAGLWIKVIVVGYLLSFLSLVVIVYTMLKLFELRKAEEKEYGTLLLAPEKAGGSNPRWKHIQLLMGGDTQSEWKEAIIEADIMLDDMLTRQGYTGSGVGEKLQQVERSDFATLQDAWEAHKVRNQIAHEGSAFDLSPTLAQRTIARYEAVFREFGAI